MLDVYEWDTGKFLGRIPQVKHTYSVVGNINEHQVAIGETTFGGRARTGRFDRGHGLRKLDVYCASACKNSTRSHPCDNRTDVGLWILQLRVNHSPLSDPNEVWIMEMIGKGVGNKGAVWVARRVPDGYVCGHANQARITTFPLNDPENCIYAKDVISFAREKGFFSGRDEEFSFADAYAPLDFGAARFCESRVWSGFRKVAKDMDQYEDYAMGMNLHNRMPLWVKADRKLTVQDVMGMMRDYFQGTKMDMTQDIGAGPYQCIVRWRPMTWDT